MKLSTDCFVKNFFDPILLLLCKDSKRNWVSTLLSSETHGLSIGQGLTLSPIRCSFKYFEQCNMVRLDSDLELFP